jgi:hypothetical protein
MCSTHRALSRDGVPIVDRCRSCGGDSAFYSGPWRGVVEALPYSTNLSDAPFAFDDLVDFIAGRDFPESRLDAQAPKVVARALIAAGKKQVARAAPGRFGRSRDEPRGWIVEDVITVHDSNVGHYILLQPDGTLIRVERGRFGPHGDDGEVMPARDLTAPEIAKLRELPAL